MKRNKQKLEERGYRVVKIASS